LAHARARARGSRLRPGKLQIDEDLREVVQERLSLDWSPEQIAAWIRREYADRPEWHVCHETIYQGLYSPSRSGLSRELTRHLRSGRPLRKRRRSPHVRTPRFRAQARLIDDRPQVAGHRVRVGDWEGDLTVGRLGATAIGTLVDRSSRLVRLVHLPAGRDASEMSRALRRVFQPMPPTARRTLTWDQGSEMSSHDTMADLFDEGIYFAHAGAPWQRGTNENTNGLLRHYFPKGTDLSVCKPERLMEIEQRLNQRPRKTLGWRTPADVHAEALACSEA
jgi:IS30 family transposase